MSFQCLKERQRAEREGYTEGLSLRVHRALSWLQRAEQCEDNDSRFIFLWIAFNAAYAFEIDETLCLSEQESFKLFLEKLSSLDTHKRLDHLIWQEFPGSIRILLDNQFVFQSFWEYQNGKITAQQWAERFADGKRAAQHALASGNTPLLLRIVFSRMYTLRNQLIHGGATWNSSVNREQLRDCVNLLGKLIPLIIELMMDNPNTLWGDACYPVVNP